MLLILTLLGNTQHIYCTIFDYEVRLYINGHANCCLILMAKCEYGFLRFYIVIVIL